MRTFRNSAGSVPSKMKAAPGLSPTRCTLEGVRRGHAAHSLQQAISTQGGIVRYAGRCKRSYHIGRFEFTAGADVPRIALATEYFKTQNATQADFPGGRS